MTPYELLLMITKHYTEEESIQIINDLIIEIENDPRKYINKLYDELEEYAYEKNRCLGCGNKLTIKEHKENRGEYFGIDCDEIMCTIECDNPECEL